MSRARLARAARPAMAARPVWLLPLLFVFVFVLLLAPRTARAQAADAGAAASPPPAADDAGPPASGDAGPPAPADAGARAAGDAGPSFEPPRAVGGTDVPYPAGAPPHTVPVVVTVKLFVDTTGTVQKVDLETAPQPVFDQAVDRAVRNFHFQPGRYGGAPVPVEITFTHTFLPPPPPPPPVVDQGPARSAILRGKLVELGTRAPVGGASISAVVGDRTYAADADLRGHFQLALPPGAARVTVVAAGHLPFLQKESLVAKQALGVTYLVERDRYDPYEIVVVGEQRREEVSRITLRGAEIKEIPGTFGDPFRVIQALPGVASVVSLLPFPVVRGASPSSTGYLLDGTRVPLLYHLLAGPSVIHPDFIDEVQFYPGGAPVTYGGYTGGIIDGRTVRARPDEHLIDFDANLLQAGGFVREPIPLLGATFTAAGRYGYPGFLLGLATSRLSLSYWDYQLRLDGGTALNGWTIFAFGANDELDTAAATATPGAPNPPLMPTLILGFDRLDLRYHRTQGHLEETARVVLGYDRTESNGTDFSVLLAEPSLNVRWRPGDRLTLVGGLEGSFHDIRQGANANPAENAFSPITADLHKYDSGSALVEALWRPTPAWLIRPGVRGDIYTDGTTTKDAADPRLTVRYKLGNRDLPEVAAGSDDSAIWLKGSAGIYHQPPRFVLPLPGLDLLPLKYGLQQSYQTSLGVEVPLQNRFQLSTEGFFNYMDPTIFDLAINPLSVTTSPNTTLVPTTIITPPMNGQDIIDRLTQPELGRAYGVEFLLRRQSKSGVFGWVSYTLSRSERYQTTTTTTMSPATTMTTTTSTSKWVPYDFDRTHLINVVAGMPLPRNWDFGVRMQYQSGLPVTTTAGYNTARADGYIRFDVRVDKRAVYRKWLLDFYVDITNVALSPEEVTPGTFIRYVLPTVGLRGRL